MDKNYSVDIDYLNTVDDLYIYLTEYNDNLYELAILLSNSTGYTRDYCENILQENNFNFLVSYRKIIEDQFKKSLNN